MFQIMQNIDESIILGINKLTNPLLDKFFILYADLGEKGILFLLIVFALMIVKKYRHVGVALFISIASSSAITMVLKEMFQRPRPFIVFNEIKPLVEESALSSMPSGHATAAFAFAIVIGYYFPKTNKFMIGFAILMCFTRLYEFVHFPSDVVIGSLIGIVCAYGSIFITKKNFSKKRFK